MVIRNWNRSGYLKLEQELIQGIGAGANKRNWSSSGFKELEQGLM